MSVRTLDGADLKGKRVLVRVDLNVPMENGRVADRTRLERVIPTIQEIADKGGKVVLLSHFGRPKGRDPEQSLKPIAAALSDVLGRPVAFAEDCIGEAAAKAVASMKEGDILLLENTRFHAGEEKDDGGFAKALATLGDVYVNDAFSAAHRAHASTEGLAHVLPSYAGRAMQAELDALAKGLEAPARPLVAVVGGAKVSTKIDLLENLVARIDALVIGGGMANTFLQAIDIGVGRSLAERDLGATARRIMGKARETNCAIILPVDAVVAGELKANAPHHTYGIDAIPSDGMILDIGAQSVDRVNAAINDAATLVWNGPLGAFEHVPFDQGTVAAAVGGRFDADDVEALLVGAGAFIGGEDALAASDEFLGDCIERGHRAGVSVSMAK